MQFLKRLGVVTKSEYRAAFLTNNKIHHASHRADRHDGYREQGLLT